MVPIPSKINTHAPIDIHDSCNCRTICCLRPRKKHHKNCELRVDQVAGSLKKSPGSTNLRDLIN